MLARILDDQRLGRRSGESTGICRVSAAHSASKVWMRSRCAISAALGSFSSTRSRISAAALIVKVMATISFGLLDRAKELDVALHEQVGFPRAGRRSDDDEARGSSAVSRGALVGERSHSSFSCSTFSFS